MDHKVIDQVQDRLRRRDERLISEIQQRNTDENDKYRQLP